MPRKATSPSRSAQNRRHSAHPLADRYIEHLLVERGLSENTLLAYSADLNDFMAFLADRRPGDAGAETASDPSGGLAEVTEQMLFLYVVHVRRKGLSGRSLARHLSALRGFFAFA